LLALDPTDAERAEVRTALLKILPTAHPGAVSDLMRVLPALVTSDAERAEVRTALLKILPTAEEWVATDLVSALRSASPLQSWLAWLKQHPAQPPIRR
jgi:hypothetical protein